MAFMQMSANQNVARQQMLANEIVHGSSAITQVNTQLLCVSSVEFGCFLV